MNDIRELANEALTQANGLETIKQTVQESPIGFWALPFAHGMSGAHVANVVDSRHKDMDQSSNTCNRNAVLPCIEKAIPHLQGDLVPEVCSGSLLFIDRWRSLLFFVAGRLPHNVRRQPPPSIQGPGRLKNNMHG